LGRDWSEVGSLGTSSSQIQIDQALTTRDILDFRIGVLGGPGASGGSAAPDDNFITLSSSVAPDNADYLLIFDSSVGAYRRQLRSVFLSGISGTVYNTATYTSDRTVNPATDDVIFMDCTSGALDVFLPTPSSCPGKRFEIKKIDATANAMTIDGGVVNIDFALTLSTSIPGQSYSVISDGIQYWIL
jgi:hypothetical protein